MDRNLGAMDRHQMQLWSLIDAQNELRSRLEVESPSLDEIDELLMEYEARLWQIVPIQLQLRRKFVKWLPVAIKKEEELLIDVENEEFYRESSILLYDSYESASEAVDYRAPFSSNNNSIDLDKEKTISEGIDDAPRNLVDLSKFVIPRGAIKNRVKSSKQSSKNSCLVCHQTFTSAFNLKRHQLHTCKTSVNCKRCGRPFAHVNALNSHMKNMHPKRSNTDDRLHKCSECGKGFLNAGALGSHMSRHDWAKKKEESADETEELVPLKIVNKNQPFKCKCCPRYSFKKALLDAHLKNQAKRKKNTCRKCKKSFVHATSLVKHMKVHMADRPYACTECDMRFERGSTLHEHMQRHSGKKPYKCLLCPRRFFTTGNRSRHMKTHEGEV